MGTYHLHYKKKPSRSKVDYVYRRYLSNMNINRLDPECSVHTGSRGYLFQTIPNSADIVPFGALNCTNWSIIFYETWKMKNVIFLLSFSSFLPFLLSFLLIPSVLLGLIPTALSLISVTVTVISLQCLHYTTYLLVTVCLEPLILDWKPQHLSTEPLGPIQYLKIKCFTV